MLSLVFAVSAIEPRDSAKERGSAMDVILAVLLLGMFCACVVLGFLVHRQRESLWHLERRLERQTALSESDSLKREQAEWKYQRLRKLVMLSKSLDALQSGIDWIENPPPDSFRPQRPSS